MNALVIAPVATYAADLGLLLPYICEVYGGVVPLGYHRKPQAEKHDWRLIQGVSAHGGVDVVSRYLHATAANSSRPWPRSCLYYCLQTGQSYAEDLAFPTAHPIAA